MTWELIQVTTEPEFQPDDSGVYTVIHRQMVDTGKQGLQICVRVDLMSVEGDEPLISFSGPAEAVRKVLMRYLDGQNADGRDKPGCYGYLLSPEHTSYIGREIQRAATDPNYVQD